MAATKIKSTFRHNANLLSFEDLRISEKTDARLGRLHFQNRTPIHTPHYVASSSRGAVPHLSQDMMRSNTSIIGLYAALEDCEYLNQAVVCILIQRGLTCVLLLEPASHREGIASVSDTSCLQFSSLSTGVTTSKIHLPPKRRPAHTRSATNTASCKCCLHNRYLHSHRNVPRLWETRVRRVCRSSSEATTRYCHRNGGCDVWPQAGGETSREDG